MLVPQGTSGGATFGNAAKETRTSKHDDGAKYGDTRSGRCCMPQKRSEPIRLKFIRSTIDPRSILVDEELNPHGFDEIYDWAKRKIDFVVIDADTGADITRIPPGPKLMPNTGLF
jgi:hypothetical protein